MWFIEKKEDSTSNQLVRQVMEAEIATMRGIELGKEIAECEAVLRKLSAAKRDIENGGTGIYHIQMPLLRQTR